MEYVLRNANVYMNGKFKVCNIFVSNGTIVDISDCLVKPSKLKIFDFGGFFVFPGLIDVHVHLREPGFSYKETIGTGTMSACHGGFTTICSMPNLRPVPDCFDNLKKQLDIIKKDALIEVIPYGSITVNQEGHELSNYDEVRDYVVGISDDGCGVSDDSIMLDAMKMSKMIIADHCEDKKYDLEKDKRFDYSKSSRLSEYKQIERDIELLKISKSKHHICHVSTLESVELIRKAKLNGLDITCETAPHYLVLTEDDICDNGNYKMNPPLRSNEDKLALIKGIKDGVIDVIATDHAPHSKSEKSTLKSSLNGIVGLETSFPILYTKLVRENIISLEKLIELMHDNPKKIFNIGTDIKIGSKANLTVFDLNSKYIINENNFLSMGKSSPFIGYEVFGKCKMTIYNGEIVWEDNGTN